MRRIGMFSFFLLFVAIGGCKTSTQSPSNTPAGTAETSTASSSPAQSGSPSAAQVAVKPKIDVCAMLNSKEIEGIQGEAVKETKLSGQAGGGLQISQCFFTLPTFSNSISLLVAQKGDGADAKNPKDFWRETFVKGAGEEKDRERERERERDKKDRDQDKKAGGRGEEEEEGSTPPQKVSGVGDDAFWVGNRVGGALYVLKGNAYLRISIGGRGDQTSKINKSKSLAQKAIARL
jgi:hypothetical protein